jgi:hypothetical protein
MAFRILLGLVCATGCFTNADRTTTIVPPVPSAGHVHVHIVVDDGSVRVATADIARVELQVVSSGYDLQHDLDLSMTPHGDQVDIIAKEHHQLHFMSHRSLRLEVRMPRDADIDVRSGDGSVDVAAITGSVDIRTGDGSVTISGARGTIRLHTGDGSIHGRDLDGSVDASTGDGSVTLAGRFDALAVHTNDGSLDATAAPGSRVLQPWHLQTTDGSVALGLPRGLGARIDASTRDGSVTSSIPLAQLGHSRAVGDINGGGLPIVVESGDGSIHLNQL